MGRTDAVTSVALTTLTAEATTFTEGLVEGVDTTISLVSGHAWLAAAWVTKLVPVMVMGLDCPATQTLGEMDVMPGEGQFETWTGASRVWPPSSVSWI